ncbi:hypothetical protein ANN_03952 [Periplaneta americana]|uniref:Uncharacterized protein n=1 Tax=Periplaneta americana TaxID=6978 RepID=A0ABQ8T8S6_PERAM|nr:hypothetical protein ANN_03952 [Periplaneta americana]
MPSTSKSGRPLRGQAREIVYNVHQFFKRQNEEHKMDINVARVTSEATGVSERVITRIVKEGIESLARDLYLSLHPMEKRGKKEKSRSGQFYSLCHKAKNSWILCRGKRMSNSWKTVNGFEGRSGY